MKLRVLADERFTCHSCTNCCRNWHVELIAGEAERIERLQWPAGDPLRGGKVLLAHTGKTFLGHRADGACIFLNESNGLPSNATTDIEIDAQDRVWLLTSDQVMLFTQAAASAAPAE